MHCRTRFINIDFVRIWKKSSLGTRMLSKKIFLSEQANFSASDWLGGNFPTVQNGPEKRKNLYLTKLVSKWKKAIRKGHTSFLVFHLWDLELVSIDSALNSASTIKNDNMGQNGTMSHFFWNQRKFFDSSTFAYTGPVTRLHSPGDSSTLA